MSTVKGLTLEKFLTEATQLMELCAILEGDKVISVVWTGSRGNCTQRLPSELKRRSVAKETWDILTTVNAKGQKVTVPCHFVYLED